MIDHTTINVRDYATSRAFYERALAPLGYGMLMEFEEEAAGFGTEGQPDFWIEKTAATSDQHVHVAFRAETRHEVDEFFQAAVEAGGRDNGGPGLRSDYGPDYYAAYVLDPDGNNVEAVCHKSE